MGDLHSGKGARDMKAIWVPILFCMICGHPLATTAADLSGVPRVIDGDTLEIQDQRVRLHGIDTPEARQTCTRDGVEWLCGQEASKALREYLQDKPPIYCEQIDTDRYRRIVAKCFTQSGEDIGEWMVRNGWALAYRRYSTDYIEAETNAKNAGRGIWAGEFAEPWNWRRR